MREKFNFWGVFVTPWTKSNRLLLTLYLLIILCLVLAFVYIKTGLVNAKMMWFFLIPIVFYPPNLVLGLLVERLRPFFAFLAALSFFLRGFLLGLKDLALW